MDAPLTAFVHYTAPPVVGGVEAVMHAHARAFLRAGWPVRVVAGQGSSESLPRGTDLRVLPELDSQHPATLAAARRLNEGQMPAEWQALVDGMVETMRQALDGCLAVIVHNVLTKHFHLPLTAALARLAAEEPRRAWVAWCHDFSATSPGSRHLLHPGPPWDLLRQPQPGFRYVTISRARQAELARLFGLPDDAIEVIPNGVEPEAVLGLSEADAALARQLGLEQADLFLLMPVRVTRAKNIELALRVTAALRLAGRRPRVVVTGPPDPHSADSMAYYHSLLTLRASLGPEEDLRFLYELSPEGRQVEYPAVAGLLRQADAVFLPSHREGFGMPVLEAGLAGVPVIASDRVPAAGEIGAGAVLIIDPEGEPAAIAAAILHWLDGQPLARLRRTVRQRYTWQAVFERQIRPLVTP